MTYLNDDELAALDRIAQKQQLQPAKRSPVVRMLLNQQLVAMGELPATERHERQP